MKRKGFTLIELLAVIVILAIIALIAVPVIMNIIEKSNKKAFENSGYGIIRAGELYYSNQLLTEEGMTADKEFIFPDNYEGLEIKGSKPVSGNMIISKEGKIALAISNGKYCVRKIFNKDEITIDEDIKTCKTKEVANVILVSEIKVPVEPIEISPGNKKTITVEISPSNATNKSLKWTSSDESIASVNNGEISALKEGATTIKVETIDGTKLIKNISIIVKQKYKSYKTGKTSEVDIIHFNPETNKKCLESEALSTGQVKKGCMRWYVIENSDESKETVNVILDHNTTSLVAWNSGDSNKSMKEVASSLMSDTSTWNSSLKIRLITADEVATIAGASSENTIKWKSSKPFGTSIDTQSEMFYIDGARNINKTSYSNIDGWQKPSANGSIKSDYTWIYDYTKECVSYGCNMEDESNYGYWTSTAVTGSTNFTWHVNRSGYLGRGRVTASSSCGVRPVITISKSNLN